MNLAKDGAEEEDGYDGIYFSNEFFILLKGEKTFLR